MKLPPRVALIWAQSINGIIGRDNKIPHEFLPDLAYFKKLTNTHTVIMGRKTWESLPFKPLPNRVNVVMTSDPNYKVPEGVKVIQNLEELEVDTEAVFFIGGKTIYELGYPYANEVYITLNHVSILGDTVAPYFDDVVTCENGWTIQQLDTTAALENSIMQDRFFFKKITGETK